MNSLMTRMTESGVTVRASLALSLLWMAASGAIIMNLRDGLLSKSELAVYSVIAGAAIVLAGIVVQKILESAAD